MPVGYLSDQDDLVSYLRAALGSAGISTTQDSTWGVCTNRTYVYWHTTMSGAKPIIYAIPSGLSLSINGCDSIHFYDVYDDEGVLIGRCVDISGNKHYTSVTFATGDVYYNSYTNGIAVLAQPDVLFAYFDILNLKNDHVNAIMSDQVYYPVYSNVYGSVVGSRQEFGDLKYVYPAFLTCGGANVAIFGDDLFPRIGSSGNIVEVNGKYYYNTNNKFIFYIGDTGFTPDLTAEKKDYEIADIVTDQTELITGFAPDTIAEILTDPTILESILKASSPDVVAVITLDLDDLIGGIAYSVTYATQDVVYPRIIIKQQ